MNNVCRLFIVFCLLRIKLLRGFKQKNQPFQDWFIAICSSSRAFFASSYSEQALTQDKPNKKTLTVW